jgi:hypothetical protein
MTQETDLERRVRELRAVCTALRPDIDDARVLSEWTTMQDQLTVAERELTARSEATPA